MLAHGFAWRRLLTASARDAPTRLARLDSLPPPALRPAARRPRARRAGRARDRREDRAAAAGGAATARRGGSTCSSRRSTSSTSSGATSASSTSRGGWRRAASGCGSSPSTPSARCRESWRRDVEAYSGLDGMLDEVEVVFGRESQGIEMSRGDTLIATTWWTAHIAARGAALARRRALPLPDPGVRAVHVPDGLVRGAGGRELHVPAHRGVLDRAAARVLPPPRASASTRGARRATPPRPRSTTRSRPSTRPTAAELAGRSPRRLLFYARPEPHAARNMFELGVLALSRARGARRVRRRLGAARHRLGARRPAARPRRRRADGAPPARAAGRLRRLHAPPRRRPRAHVHARTRASCRSRWPRPGW